MDELIEAGQAGWGQIGRSIVMSDIGLPKKNIRNCEIRTVKEKLAQVRNKTWPRNRRNIQVVAPFELRSAAASNLEKVDGIASAAAR